MYSLLAAGGGGDSHDLCKSPLVATEDNTVGCDDHKYQAVHDAEEALFWVTITILATFEAELLFLVYLLGPKKFFHHFLYILDLFIITVSIGLELTFHLVHRDNLQALPGILIIFRLWRFIRIGE